MRQTHPYQYHLRNGTRLMYDDKSLELRLTSILEEPLPELHLSNRPSNILHLSARVSHPTPNSDNLEVTITPCCAYISGQGSLNISWWRHDMRKPFAYYWLLVWESSGQPVLPPKMPAMECFDILVAVSLHKLLNKEYNCQWLGTL